jgi:hypothetical protein
MLGNNALDQHVASIIRVMSEDGGSWFLQNIGILYKLYVITAQLAAVQLLL